MLPKYLWRLSYPVLFISLLCLANTLNAVDTVHYDGIDYVLSKSRDEITIPYDIPETHTVIKGDTLWDISRMYLNDPFLWPVIWEENLDHVSNPHLIFPNQIIRLPRPGGMPPEGMEPHKLDEPAVPGEEEFAAGPSDEREELEGIDDYMPRPVVSGDMMATCGYIAPDKKKAYSIIGAVDPDFSLSKGDICYIDAGIADNVQVGDNFYVFQYLRKVYHPITKKFMGWYTNNLGVIRLICVFEHSSMALVQRSFQEMRVGDLLAPYGSIPSPLTRRTGIDICTYPTKELGGYIIDSKENEGGFTDNVLIFKKDICYIDLGYTHGVGPGDYFLIYNAKKPHPATPEYTIGEMIILRSSNETSTCYVTRSFREIYVGTPVDYLLLPGPPPSVENLLPGVTVGEIQ